MKPTFLILIFTLLLNFIAIGQTAEPVQIRPLNSRIGTVLKGLVLPPVTEGYTRPEKPLTPSEICEINKPATVLVSATYDFTVTYPKPGSFMMDILKIQANTAALSGNIGNDNASKLNYMLGRIAANPGTYLTPSTSMQIIQFTPTSQGSGAFITPDGYVVTNAHVVEMDIPHYQNMAAENILTAIVNEEIGKLVAEFGVKPNAEVLESCLQAIFTYYAKYLTLAAQSVSYAVKTGKTVEVADYKLAATLISKGGAVPNKDVAILKVQGSNFPTVAFGDDRLLKPGDKLYVIGYPGTVENNDLLKQNVMKQPSCTEGMMNARQETVQGWTAIQLDAATYKGNSGGPVFNQFGEAVGLLTFGSENEDKSDLVQGFNFIVPAHIAGEFIRAASITPKLGTAMQLYRQAMGLKQNGKTDKAIELLNQVYDYNNDWPYWRAQLGEMSIVGIGKPQKWYNYLFNDLKLRWYHYTGLLLLIGLGLIKIFGKLFN